MIVLLMEVHVKPERRDEFIALIRDVATCSERDEDGCLRFDVLQDSTDDNCFHFYDVYRDDAARLNHRTTPHYQRWVDGTKDMFTEPSVARWTTSLHPEDAAWR